MDSTWKHCFRYTLEDVEQRVRKSHDREHQSSLTDNALLLRHLLESKAIATVPANGCGLGGLLHCLPWRFGQCNCF